MLIEPDDEPLPEWRREELARKYAPKVDEREWQDDYADAVCIPRFGEL